MNLAFLYIKKNFKFFLMLVMNLLVISFVFFSCVILISDNTAYGKKIINDNLFRNFYEYESGSYDTTHESFTYEISDKELILPAKITISENIKELNLYINALAFENDIIPDCLSKAMSYRLIGRTLNNDNEIMLSSNLATLILGDQRNDYINIIGKKISLENSSGKVFLDNKEIVGVYIVDYIWAKEDTSAFMNSDMIIGYYSFNYDNSKEITRIIFETFTIEEEIDKIDKEVNGIYHGAKYQSQIHLIEQQNAFLIRIFIVLLSILFVAILVNCVILIKSQIRKSLHFFSLIRILGMNRKKIARFNYLIYLIVILLETVLSFALSVGIMCFIIPLVFSRASESLLSINVLLTVIGLFLIKYLAFFLGTLFNMKIFILKDSTYK